MQPVQPVLRVLFNNQISFIMFCCIMGFLKSLSCSCSAVEPSAPLPVDMYLSPPLSGPAAVVLHHLVQQVQAQQRSGIWRGSTRGSLWPRASLSAGCRRLVSLLGLRTRGLACRFGVWVWVLSERPSPRCREAPLLLPRAGVSRGRSLAAFRVSCCVLVSVTSVPLVGRIRTRRALRSVYRLLLQVPPRLPLSCSGRPGGDPAHR